MRGPHTHQVAEGFDYAACSVVDGYPPHTHRMPPHTHLIRGQIDKTDPGGVDGHRHVVVWTGGVPVLRTEVESYGGTD